MHTDFCSIQVENKLEKIETRGFSVKENRNMCVYSYGKGVEGSGK